MIGASTAFAFMNALTKAVSGTIPTPEIAFFRCLFSVTLLTPLLVRRGISFLGVNRRLLFLRGAFGFVSLVLGFYAISGLRLADASILWKSSAIFTALFAFLFLGERITPRMGICIAVGLVGTCLVVKPSLEIVNLHGLAGVGGGMALGAVACSVRGLQRTEKSWTIVYAFCFWGTALSLVFAPGFVAPTWRELGILSCLGMTGTVGQYLYTEAFRFADAAFVQPYSFSEVLAALVIGYVGWNERPDGVAALGAALIVASGIGLVRAQRRADPPR